MEVGNSCILTTLLNSCIFPMLTINLDTHSSLWERVKYEIEKKVSDRKKVSVRESERVKERVAGASE